MMKKNKLKLIVFTGWPGDGKSELSNKIENNSYSIISIDDLRKEMYEEKHNQLNYPEEWCPIWSEAILQRDRILSLNKNVIIDSCAHTKRIRDFYFNTSKIEKILNFRDLSLNKYLVNLTVKEEERHKRLELDGDLIAGKQSIKRMQKEFQEPEMYLGPDTNLIFLENNTLEDQLNCKDYLMNKL